MNKVILTAAICFLTFLANSQMVTLQQLLDLRTHDISHVEEVLTGKQWEVLKVEKESEKGYGTIAFAYNRKSGTSIANAFIDFKYTSRAPSYNMISIQFDGNITLYSDLVSQSKRLGFAISKSEVKDNQILKTYVKGDIIITVLTATVKNDTGTLYAFVISKDKNTYKGRD